MDDSDDNFSAFEKNTICAKNNASIFTKLDCGVVEWSP